MKYDVFAIGNALVDYEIEVDNAFLENHQIEKSLMTLVDAERQKILIDAVQGKVKEKQGGGSAANTIVALSSLGGTGYYACKVADDEDGRIFLRDLEANGVRTSLVEKKLPAGTTGKCLVMVSPDAERTMNTFLGITTDFSVNEVNFEELKESGYLFMEGYLVTSDSSFEAMKEAKKVAKENNVKVSLTFSDPSMVKYFKPRLQEIVGDSVDLLFCNEEEAMLFTDTTDLLSAREALKDFADHFVITLGKNGAIIYDGDTYIDIEPYPVEAVDSNGAGDIFSGAFLYGITKGHTYASSGKLASKAGSVVVSSYGPRLSKDKLEELKHEVFANG